MGGVAALLRAAHVTLKGWAGGWRDLLLASDEVSISQASKGLLGAKCWKSRPFALHLEAARVCFSDVDSSNAPKQVSRFLNGWLRLIPAPSFSLPGVPRALKDLDDVF